MKKLFLMMVTAVAILTTSCSKQTTLENRLDGETWKVTQMDVTYEGITESGLEAGVTTTLAFEKDGKGTWSTTGEASESFTWSVSSDGKTITLTQGTDVLTFTVTDNSSKKQVWTMSQTDEGFTYTMTIGLEKQ
ncbi:MAG: hypothetical protein ACO3EE_02520 [Flavobacteriales bacterium]